jgi:hypothetical protein
MYQGSKKMNTQKVKVVVWKTKHKNEIKIYEKIHYIIGASIVSIDLDMIEVHVNEYQGDRYKLRQYGLTDDRIRVLEIFKP